MKIQRIKDNQFISLFEEGKGTRHTVTTTDISKALDFTEEQCVRICDHDFFGEPYHRSGYNKHKRQPEFKRFTL